MFSDGVERAQSRIHLTWAYVGALGLVAALVLAQEGLVHVLLDRQELDAETINLAGRQRMLSQKIAKSMLAPAEGKKPFERAAEYENDVITWETTHHRLRGEDAGNGLPKNSVDVERLFDLLDPHFRVMIAAARTADDTPNAPDQSGRRAASTVLFLAHEDQYLTLMNEIVFAYAREARARVSRLQNLEIGLSAAIVFVLLLEALLIFRPMVRRVRQTLEALAEAKRSAEALSLHDALTGIPNRRHFDTVFEREYRRSARMGSSVATLMIDLDQFKSLNDRAGHEAGDLCLARVARALTEQMRRPGDLVARYGGDEFVVCLPDTTLEGAGAVASRLQQTIENLEIHIDGSSDPASKIRASVGIAAQIPSGREQDPSSLIRRADLALYQDKATRRRGGSLVHG